MISSNRWNDVTNIPKQTVSECLDGFAYLWNSYKLQVYHIANTVGVQRRDTVHVDQ